MFKNLFKRKPAPIAALAKRSSGLFSTHADDFSGQDGAAVAKRREKLARLLTLPAPVRITRQGNDVATFDANDVEDSVKPIFGLGVAGISETQLMWYASQGFIGYQMCAILAQHWMIDKACTMPAKDAVRKGYNITLNNGQKLKPDVLDYMREMDEDKYDINFNMQEFIRFGRIFGIRVCKFVVESDDPDYYLKPFNIDGVQPYTYKGIAQIDPYWIVPELSSEETLKPGGIHFYEPQFWRINGKSIHRSHLVIYRTGQVADVLKPSYYYGGVSIPQAIYERVYAAERVANEGPMLAMTKRLTVLNTSLEEALADQDKFDERMNWWVNTRDNYGVKINETGDTLEQFETSLTGFDELMMSEYQIVAAIAGVPGTKLLGTQPKGFNSTGEFEESSYHETLESLQTDDLNKLLRRHYQLMIKSHINPKFNLQLRNVTPVWNELDAMTSLEQAQLNLTNAQVGGTLIASGAIEPEAELKRIIADPDSGYTGLTMDDLPDMPDPADDAGGSSGGQGGVAGATKNVEAPKPRAVAVKPTPGA
jgi:phage-related protein (TIGR01555 family)